MTCSGEEEEEEDAVGWVGGKRGAGDGALLSP